MGDVAWLREPGEPALHLSGILVLTLAGEQISALTRFARSNVPAPFPLPETLDA